MKTRLNLAVLRRIKEVKLNTDFNGYLEKHEKNVANRKKRMGEERVRLSCQDRESLIDEILFYKLKCGEFDT